MKKKSEIKQEEEAIIENEIIEDIEADSEIIDEEKDPVESKPKKKLVPKLIKVKNKKNKEIKEIVRYETNIETGLSHEVVEERVAMGLVNHKQIGSTKSKKRIVFDNLVTFFNILTFAIAGWLISVGAWKDLMFVAIVSANIGIGIFQEIRAKNTIDRLSILSSPTADVIRGGNSSEIAVNEIVLDDLICLETGKQICSDSIVVDGSIEVNEALLTGESDAISKKIGDRLLSGSFVVSGKCKARVDAIGKDNYIEKLTYQAKKYNKPKSELLKTLNNIIKFMAVIVVVVGTLLFFSQYEKFSGNLDYVSSVRKTAGAVIGMIPSGLYLLTSIGLAVGVIKLSQNQVLVQELYCIEMLARVNVLCLDKTGTITDGTMSVKNVIDYNSIGGMSTKNIISAILNATNDENLTSKALEDAFGRGKRIKAKAVIPFSSQRKLSAVTFEKIGTFVLGAPEFVMTKNYRLIENDVLAGATQGYRVLAIAHTQESIEDDKLPKVELSPVALILIEDTIRPDAIKNIEYFRSSGVEVKVISGDNPITVSKVSERAGIERANQYISLDGLTDAEVARAASKYTVFGRVSPAQKKLLVQTLKSEGKTVAMTGDGVNDILALKEADCSIAVASGSEAARNVSHLVLLDSNFNSMPKVVAEGRRVINNVAKVACLFLTKTIFSLLLALYALYRGSYPISTNQLIMIDFLCIGAPSFFLIMEKNDKISSGKFFVNILKGALPGAIVILINSLFVFGLADNLDMNDQISSTVIVVIATFTCMMVLFQTCRPFNFVKKVMFTTLFTAFIFITLLMPKFLDFSPIVSVGDYYDSELKIETVKYMPSVMISQKGYYVIDGVYTDHFDKSQDGQNHDSKIVDGYLVVDGITMKEFAITPRISYSYESGNNTPQYVIDSKITDIEVSSTCKLTIKENGDVYINGVYTKYNCIPTVKDNGKNYVIDNVTTNIKSTGKSIESVTIKNMKLYINGVEINYVVPDILVSTVDDYFALGGTKTEYFITVDNPVITLNSDRYYVVNDVITSTRYLLNVFLSSENHCVIDGEYTDYVFKQEGTVVKLSTTKDGYLKINGEITDYKLEMITTIGGNVQRIPLPIMLLTICLCTLSWPLMAVMKGIIPWIKKQITLAVQIINKF